MSSEYMRPFSLSADADYEWPTKFSAKSTRSECIQIMHASYMHFLNAIDFEALLDRKDILDTSANPTHLTQCLVEEVKSYEKILIDAAGQAPLGIKPSVPVKIDLSMIEEWGNMRYAKVYQEVSKQAVAAEKEPSAKMQKVLDSRPEKLLQSAVEQCVHDLYADVDESPIVMTKDELASSLNNSLKSAGVALVSQDREKPWMKKKWQSSQSSQWDKSASAAWESKKKPKSANVSATAWAPSGSEGWGSQSASTPVFRGAYAPGMPPIAWNQFPPPPPPPSNHAGLFWPQYPGPPA
jgi:hypothetical protein